MEENVFEVDSGSEIVHVSVDVDNVTLNGAQYDALVGEVVELQNKTDALNASVVHATSFLVLLCVFQLYGLLSRARKKGGV